MDEHPTSEPGLQLHLTRHYSRSLQAEMPTLTFQRHKCSQWALCNVDTCKKFVKLFVFSLP